MFLKIYVQLKNKVYSLKNDERGISAVEYGILLAFIAVAVTAGATILGPKIRALLSSALP